MKFMGIGDEGANSIDGQIQAAQELGWKLLEPRGVEVPGFAKANFHDLPDEAFDLAVRKLESRGHRRLLLRLHHHELGQEGRATPSTSPSPRSSAPSRACSGSGAKYIRIMSFKPGDDEYRIPAEVFRRVKEVTNRFLDAGLQPVHENCMNYGGMSWQHALELLDKCPGLKWVFDTANPIFNPDRSKPKPWPKQDPWEFWTHVRDHAAHIHIKDATWNPAKNDADYNWPGEGQGRVRDILKDALARGYDAGLSIEPHMVVVFHDAQAKAANEDAMRQNYVEYGRRLEKMVGEIRNELDACAKAPAPARRR